MDPAATLRLFLDACVEQTTTNDTYPREEALEALDNLRDWINKGGFLPFVSEIDVRCGNTYKIGQ